MKKTKKIATCKVEGCIPNWPGFKGYCAKHYQRWRKYGDPLIERKPGWAPGDPNNPAKSPHRRAALSALRRTSRTSPETRAKISAAMKAALQRPEIKAKWLRPGKPHTEESRRKMKATNSVRRPKKMSTLLAQLDGAFSIYIRTKYSDHTGRVQCFTCAQCNPIKEMDCGHYVSRQHKSLRWSEENAHPQCRYCNRYCEGRKDVYAVRLIEKYGAGVLQRLQEKKMEVFNLDRAWLQEQINYWQGRYKALQSERTTISDAYTRYFEAVPV